MYDSTFSGSRLDFFPWKESINPCEPLNYTAGEATTKALFEGRYVNVPKNPARYLRLGPGSYLKHVTWTSVGDRKGEIFTGFGKCRDFVDGIAIPHFTQGAYM